MDRYDRDWGAGRAHDRSGWGYASDFGSWGDAWGTAPRPGFNGRGVGLYRQWGTAGAAYGGYDRGEYGARYPGYGGRPGGRNRGSQYGGYGADYARFGAGYQPDHFESPYGGYGRSSGYSRWGAQRGYGYRGYGRGGYDQGYDQGYDRGTFLPEQAYREHPEMNHPQRPLSNRWPARNNDEQWNRHFSDDEVVQSVRQNLHQDDYIDAGRIDVSVNGNVVTLKGEVNDYLEARYAWDDAWEADGVRGVLNQLTVRLDKPLDEHEEPFTQTTGGQQNAPKGKKK